jgi:hypothetical protein
MVSPTTIILPTINVLVAFGCLLLIVRRRYSDFNEPKGRLHKVMKYCVLALSVCTIACSTSVFATYAINKNDTVLPDPLASCAVTTKFAAFAYVFGFFFKYVYLFCKQRLVRPMSGVSKLERILSVGMLWVPVLSVISLFACYPTFAADGECQPHIPLGWCMVMFATDLILSGGSLFLLLRPVYRMMSADDPMIKQMILRNTRVCCFTVFTSFVGLTWVGMDEALHSPGTHYGYAVASSALCSYNCGIIYITKSSEAAAPPVHVVLSIPATVSP